MLKWIFRLLFVAVFLALGAVVLTKSLPVPGVIPILMYHSIGSRDDAKERKNFVSRESFFAQMRFLKSFGFRVISLETYERILKGEAASKGREVVITFDDGNETFMQEAWPALKKYSFPITLFLVSESVKQQINGSMPLEDFQELLRSGFVTIGAQTKTHPALPELSNRDALMEEIRGSKKDLEELLKTPVHYFSYPNGDLDSRSVQAVRNSDYHLAFTTSFHKLKGFEETPYSITRLNITRSSDNPIIFWAKITGLYQVHKQYWQKLKAWLR